jgi:uncharacterized protein (DUF2236 family)
LSEPNPCAPGFSETPLAVDRIRSAIRAKVHGLVGVSGGPRPPGGPGLFPRDAVVRRVHADFPTMMIGGAASLLLQMLHPGALGGVWDHSDFRKDMSGRLRRTAQFIGTTTYRPREEALTAIARVRRIHDRVHGMLADGTAYSANDPELLAWVHVAEAACVLAAHRRYREPFMTRADQDRYCAELAEIGRLLGAVDVPTSADALQRRLDGFRAHLRSDERTREVAAALIHPRDPTVPPPVQAMLMQAGADLLPGWAAAMHGMHLPQAGKPLLRAAALGTATVLRWALRS